MSELTDSIRSSVGKEWVSTREIARQLGTSPQRVYTALMSDLRFKLVERRTHGRTTFWRRVA